MTAIIDPWADFDEACQSFGNRCCESGPDDSDAEDEFGNSVAESLYTNLRTRSVRLPCGDVHVCDKDCPYGVENKLTGDSVCVYTGCVVGRCTSERTDNSTGRSTWSVDPDVNCGIPQSSQWRKKRDMKTASKQAYMSAKLFNDSLMPTAVTSNKKSIVCKRGALCVDEPDVEQVPKRVRASKKNLQSISARAALITEARHILSKLMGNNSFDTHNAPVIDPRLLNRELIYTAALKKYLKETLARGGAVAIDDIHNIALAVDKVITDETRKQSEATPLDYKTMFTDTASRLAVSLWMGACSTPYLAKARRGADSFRPFCCGAFYALKRGIALPDGTILIPKVDDFADSLPTPRAISADPASKALHASSHRGLCTIHRAIASVDPKKAPLIFADTIRVARTLYVS